jgi:3-phosphoglycerate kinase
MIENLATRTFIVGNLSDKSGKVKPQNTMKFVWNALSSKVDQPIHFQEEYELEHDSEGVFMLENLNFHPEEWGFIEPDAPVKPENPEGEGDAEQEHEPVVDDKNKGKVNPKDKKAEEAKKKAEEEAKKAAEEAKKQKELEMKKAAEESEHQNPEGEGEGEAEPEPIPDITYKEIEAFKNKLSALADIYINDALDASLTHSNTIADLRIPVKVMGIRMTEEVRKLGMFFKYSHSPTFAIIGGTFK